MADKFIEIDLKKPMQYPSLPGIGDSLWILAFWGEHPLGWMIINNREKLTRLDKKVMEDFIWQLWQQVVSGNSSTNRSNIQAPPISVVICTRDRRISLERCLKSLMHQDYPLYEVIVVDNGSHDGSIQATVEEYGFRYVREDRLGLDWARNRGIQAATHEIIAFIDDDAVASPGWLSGIAQGFEDPEIMIVTGLVLPAELETKAQFDFETYGGMGKGFYRFTIHPSTLTDQQKLWTSSWGVGTNMAFRRSVIAIIGDFDVALDVGTPSCGGGDIEFFYRAIAAGCTLRYQPSAWVRHFHRRDTKALSRQIYNNGRSFPNYLLTIARKQPEMRWAVFKFALYHWLWRWIIRRIISAIISGNRFELRVSLIEFLGSLTSIPAYWYSQHTALRRKTQGGELGV